MDHPLSERVADLRARKQEALTPGSERAIERQHSRGKMLARERIEYLLDPGSFHELDGLAKSRNPTATEKPAMPPEMWVPLLIMVLGFYCFFAVSLLLRMRLEVLRRESRASWVKAEVERSL